MIAIGRNLYFWLVCLAYSLGGGVYGSFTNILAVDLRPYDISESESDWIGFYSTLAGIAAGILIGRLADIFQGRFRLLMLILFALSGVSFLWFVLIVEGVLPAQLGE